MGKTRPATMESTTGKRPKSITVICIFLFLGAPVSMAVILSPAMKHAGPWWMPPFLGLATLIGLTCTFGLWKMKKWAAYTYTGFVGLNQIFLIARGDWNILALAPVIIVFFALMHVSKMT